MLNQNGFVQNAVHLWMAKEGRNGHIPFQRPFQKMLPDLGTSTRFAGREVCLSEGKDASQNLNLRAPQPKDSGEHRQTSWKRTLGLSSFNSCHLLHILEALFSL